MAPAGIDASYLERPSSSTMRVEALSRSHSAHRRPTPAHADVDVEVSSPRREEDGSDWHIVDYAQGSDSAGSTRSLVMESEEVAAAAAPIDTLDVPADDALAHESERLADTVLCQPFPAEVETVLAEVHEEVDAAATEVETVRLLSRLSQEGSLDAYSDDEDGLRLGPGNEGLALLGNDEHTTWPGLGGMLGNGVCELQSTLQGFVHREVSELRSLLVGAVRCLWSRVVGAKNVTLDISVLARQAVDKVLGKRAASSRWVLLSVGALTTLTTFAMVGLAYQMRSQQSLRVQLKQRDRELARLVVKILNLQDVLQQARSVPLLRHTSIDRFTSIM